MVIPNVTYASLQGRSWLQHSKVVVFPSQDECSNTHFLLDLPPRIRSKPTSSLFRRDKIQSPNRTFLFPGIP